MQGGAAPAAAGLLIAAAAPPQGAAAPGLLAQAPAPGLLAQAHPNPSGGFLAIMPAPQQEQPQVQVDIRIKRDYELMLARQQAQKRADRLIGLGSASAKSQGHRSWELDPYNEDNEAGSTPGAAVSGTKRGVSPKVYMCLTI